MIKEIPIFPTGFDLKVHLDQHLGIGNINRIELELGYLRTCDVARPRP